MTNEIQNPAYDRLKQLKKKTLTRYMLDPELLSDKKPMPLAQNLGGALVLLAPVLVFWILPRIGFSPGFFSKLLLMVGLWVVVGVITRLVDVRLKKKYTRKFEEAAQYFVRTAMNGLAEQTAGLAEITVWCERNQKDFFRQAIRRHCRRYAMENRLDPADLAGFENRLREIVRMEKEQRKAQHHEKLAKIELARESLRAQLYRFDKHPEVFIQDQLRAELLPVSEEISIFHLIARRSTHGTDKEPVCTTGNLHLAVAPGHLVFLLDNQLDVSMAPNPITFLLQNSHSPMYILPASFLKKLDIDIFGSRMDLELHSPLPRIIMAYTSTYTNPKNHKQLIRKSWQEPLKSLHLDLDSVQSTSWTENLKTLTRTVSNTPECPICLEFSQIQRTGGKKEPSGFTCSRCGTRYSWGVDFSRRVTLFPNPGNQKENQFLEFQ